MYSLGNGVKIVILKTSYNPRILAMKRKTHLHHLVARITYRTVEAEHAWVH